MAKLAQSPHGRNKGERDLIEVIKERLSRLYFAFHRVHKSANQAFIYSFHDDEWFEKWISEAEPVLLRGSDPLQSLIRASLSRQFVEVLRYVPTRSGLTFFLIGHFQVGWPEITQAVSFR